MTCLWDLINAFFRLFFFTHIHFFYSVILGGFITLVFTAGEKIGCQIETRNEKGKAGVNRFMKVLRKLELQIKVKCYSFLYFKKGIKC